MTVRNRLLGVCLLAYLGLIVQTPEVFAKDTAQRDFYSSAQLFSQVLPSQPSEKQMNAWTEELLYLYLWSKDNFAIQQETQLEQKIQKFADALTRWEQQADTFPAASRSALKALNAAFLLLMHEYDAAQAAVKAENGQYAQVTRVLVGEAHPEYPQIWQISLVEARKLLKAHPDSLLAKMTFLEAVLEMGEGLQKNAALLVEAEQVVSKTKVLNQDYLYFHYQKAQLLYYQGKQDAAFQMFDRLLNQSPKNAVLAEAVGNFYRWVKLYARSLQTLTLAQKMQPQQPRLYRKLESVHLALDRPLDAIKMYLSGLQFIPKELSFYDALLELSSKAELKQVLEETTLALEKTPNNIYLLLFQGEINLQLAQKEAAKLAFERAVQLSPPLPQAYSSLLYFYWQERDWEALQGLLVKARQLPDILPLTYYWTGLLALELNQPKQAIEALSQASLKDSSVQQALVMAYKQAKQFVKARELLQLMLKENPKDVRLLLSMGDIYSEEKKLEKAEDYYLWAHKIEPYNPSVYFSLGNLYADSNRSDLAVDAFERSILIQPEDLDSRNNLGNVFLKNKDYVAAVLHFQRILKLDPNYATAYYNIACAYALNRQNEAALLFLKRALEKDQNLKTLAGSDPDFSNLRQDQKFQEMVR
ncbi:MAG: tetratricopeptide repeat protein [Candidatus Sericytochromatia bacterium]|nr:tetratricopeptide repeat protein [Candidatus Sericytochromatia bacterium]